MFAWILKDLIFRPLVIVRNLPYKLAKANLERWKHEMIRKRTFWSVLLFITLAVSIVACSPSAKKQSSAARSIPVEAGVAIQKSIPIQMNAMGSVEPFQTISVRSQITAQIGSPRGVNGLSNAPSRGG